MAKNNVIRQQHLPAYPSIVQTIDAVNVKRSRPTALFCYSICKTGQLTSIATLTFQKTNRYAVVGQIVIRFLSNLAQNTSYFIPNSRKQQITNSRLITKYLRKFGIKHCRYVFCCVALVDEKAISLPVQSCSGGMVSYPKLANQPFRRSYFHRSDNTLAKP